MTKDERTSLGADVRATGNRCLEVGDALTAWLAKHPAVVPEEARSVAVLVQRIPFQSIRGRVEGPYPVRPEYPYWDGRVLGYERGEIRVTPCLHEEAVTITRIDPQTSPGLPR